jgi:hypothetical protein
MASLTVENLFDTAYAATVISIKATGYATDEPWGKLIPSLRGAVGDIYFNETGEPALTTLRKSVASAVNKGTSEGKFLAAGAGLAIAGGATTAVSDASAGRCAALKTLRHTYFLRKRGSQKIWIVSLPKSYSEWPDRYLKGTLGDLLTRLNAGSEQFSESDRKHIADAAQTGLKWVHKAQIVLDDIGPKSSAMTLLKRWFADEDTTADQLTTFAATLKAGLKKIPPKLSGGCLMITDFVPLRHSTDAGDIGFRKSNAFVWADTRDVVYIEPGFFTKGASNVFQKDARHWARIMVHEMTHREAKTDDKRYGWNGIQPVKGTFPHSDAIVNADSWAIFVADAAGAMSSSDRKRALGGTA